MAIAADLRQQLEGYFHLESCQRWLWVGEQDEVDGDWDPSIEIFSGIHAYQLLLRVATGLESQIVDETAVFGQLKEAWKKELAVAGETGHPLNCLMQKVFEDTKDIRSRFLQNVGGASYGSLVRMLLRGQSGPTLVVGAGQLAQSVAPYLLEAPEVTELWVSNRSQEKREAFVTELRARGSATPVEAVEVEYAAWQEARNVVVCIPLDELKDQERTQLRKQVRQGGVVIHLGGQRAEAGQWLSVEGFKALDDLFELQRAQGDVRTVLVTQAARACAEKAKLRGLGASVSIPHGWEDLAVFA